MTSILSRIRIRQIRICGRWLRRMSNVPAIFALIRIARDAPVLRNVLAALTGYNRPFPTSKDAAAAIAGWEGGGHSNPEYHAVKLTHAAKLRPGDYAALFHMERMMPRLRQVFDLGGSVGELFYFYSTYLTFPSDFVWTVCDLPETNARGQDLANAQHETRLRFTPRFSDASGTDLLMICGALHYFEQPLQMIAELTPKPRNILINRAPLVDGPGFATVEDGDIYRLVCMCHSRPQLVHGLESLGYELVDSWPIRGRAIVVPCYPDRAAQYRGLLFRLRNAEASRS